MMCSSLFILRVCRKNVEIKSKLISFFAYALDAYILYYESRICVCEVGDYKKNIIYNCHNIIF